MEPNTKSEPLPQEPLVALLSPEIVNGAALHDGEVAGEIEDYARADEQEQHGEYGDWWT